MFVKQLRYFLAFSLIFFLFQVPVTYAQVFPGDADNNGIVNHLDVLNVGYAFNSTGPARLESGGQPAIQQIPVLWDEFFPQGLNYAFADADGNGWVNYFDLALIASNYGETHANGTEEIIFYPGTPDIHPPLMLDISEVPAFPTGSSHIEISLYLGNEDLPMQSFQGIGFTVEYDSEFIVELDFNFDESSWINSGEGSINFVGLNQEEGIKEIALSRKGANPVDGNGKIGTLSLIVIDDLGTLLASPTDSSDMFINISNIRAVNGDFWVVPVVSDSLSLMVYGPNAIPTSTKEPVLNNIKVYPNPIKDLLNIESPTGIQALNLYDLTGELIISAELFGEKEFTLNFSNQIKNGFYLLQIRTLEGVLTKKLLIQQD